MKKLRGLLLLGLVGVGAGYWYWQHDDDPVLTYRTAAVVRADLVLTTNATGTLEPEEVVDVGAQVLGMIKHFGANPEDPSQTIDYGTHVEKDSVLAQIDDTLYKSQVAAAQANLQRAEADLEQLRARHRQASRDWERARRLQATPAMAQSEYDSYQAAYETTRANLGSGEAAVTQAREALNQAKINLGYTLIRSPVKGVIIDRRVNVGQTVVASLNAPSLFLIARDLKHMRIWASVNEADIGRIRPDMPVTFTVDAFPDEVFTGVVSQRRLNATMIQNVVTYTVVVRIENPDEKLLPYLTANVRFEIARRNGALVVPNLALQWRPDPKQMAPTARNAAGAVPAPTLASSSPGEKGRQPATVWVVDGSHVRPVPVFVGLSDGTLTQVVAGLAEGDSVVVGAEPVAGSGTTSPFLPNVFGGKKP
jgi:HlyD family secretion protein